MLEHFNINLETKLRINKSHKILLAISGGADSIVMLDLFAKSNFICGVAHCNFHLRRDESNKDEKLVEELANSYNFPFYKIDFQTKNYAKENGISIEMAARELRYNWFEEIRQKFDYQYIAVAHHQDDVIETFFINLTRGTGIRGLSGIKEKTGNIIRPLLFTDRKGILHYIDKNNLEFRDDHTNEDTNIIRNRFRHQILPLLKEVNPAAEDNILQTIENLRAAENIMKLKVEEVTNELGVSKLAPVKINIAKLRELKLPYDILYEIVRMYNFNSTQAKDIFESLNRGSGKSFHSNTHLLIKDRTELIITSIKDSSSLPLLINAGDEIINLGKNNSLTFEKIERGKNFEIPIDHNIAAIDYDKLNFPIKIKEWERGDYFYPLGMQQKKKLSDFFIDEKFSLIDKQEALLLTSDNQTVWLIGKRIDNRFKITDKTKNILLIKLDFIR